MCFSRKNRIKKRTIAIVNKPTTISTRPLNIDDLVDPRMTTVSELWSMYTGELLAQYTLLDGDYEFIEAKISEKSELVNKKIKESNFPENIRIGAIIRKEKVVIPRSVLFLKKMI